MSLSPLAPGTYKLVGETDMYTIALHARLKVSRANVGGQTV